MQPAVSRTGRRAALAALVGATLLLAGGLFAEGVPLVRAAAHGQATTAGPQGNVDASSPGEDRSPSGTPAPGQSEESIAAVGPDVVEAWNDATGAIAPCPSPRSREEGVGLGFSADGGASFADEGGLPNPDCQSYRFAADPAVAAWAPAGQAWFYVSALYQPSAGAGHGPDRLAIVPCHVVRDRAAAALSCGQPAVTAASSSCSGGPSSELCSGLDKPFVVLDPRRGRLYVSYTEITTAPQLSFRIELAICDLGSLSGEAGPAGGAAGRPVCDNGGTPAPSPAYLSLTTPDPCEDEGAYPAVDEETGDVYVAYEHNWVTNVVAPTPAQAGCTSQPVQNVMNRVAFSCLVLAPASPCSGPSESARQDVVSLDTVDVPGDESHTSDDNPRIAVSGPAHTVSMVWNDAREHPLGDVYLLSYQLASLQQVQPAPVRLNSQTGGLHLMPALRGPGPDGTLDVTFYQRARPDSSVTDLQAVLHLDPRTATGAAPQLRVTTAPTDWAGVSSFTTPSGVTRPRGPTEFGDYTDAYVSGSTLYVAWADGRSGIPQPFEARIHL